MSKKTKWISTDDLPDNIKDIICRFEQAFDISTTSYKITNVLDYAVWFQVYGRINVAKLARLQLNSPDCFIEIEAIANKYTTIMVWQDMHGMNIRACIAWAKEPFSDGYEVPNKILSNIPLYKANA